MSKKKIKIVIENVYLHKQLEKIKQETKYCPECGKKLNWRKHFVIIRYDEVTGGPLVKVIYLNRSTFWGKLHKGLSPIIRLHHSLIITKIGDTVSEMCGVVTERKIELYCPKTDDIIEFS